MNHISSAPFGDADGWNTGHSGLAAATLLQRLHWSSALNRGQVSNKGEASARMENGVLKAAYKGSLTVGDLLAVDKQNSADFLKWKSLYLGNIDFRLDPMAIMGCLVEILAYPF